MVMEVERGRKRKNTLSTEGLTADALEVVVDEDWSEHSVVVSGSMKWNG